MKFDTFKTVSVLFLGVLIGAGFLVVFHTLQVDSLKQEQSKSNQEQNAKAATLSAELSSAIKTSRQIAQSLELSKQELSEALRENRSLKLEIERLQQSLIDDPKRSASSQREWNSLSLQEQEQLRISKVKFITDVHDKPDDEYRRAWKLLPVVLKLEIEVQLTGNPELKAIADLRNSIYKQPEVALPLERARSTQYLLESIFSGEQLSEARSLLRMSNFELTDAECNAIYVKLPLRQRVQLLVNATKNPLLKQFLALGEELFESVSYTSKADFVASEFMDLFVNTPQPVLLPGMITFESLEEVDVKVASARDELWRYLLRKK